MLKNLTKTMIYYITLQIFLVFLFTILYYVSNKIGVKYKLISNRTHKPVKKVTLFDCLHFSLITQTTVGYHGQNAPETPETNLSKIINTIQLFVILGTFSLAFYK